jgi:hypothetical protein
MFNYKVEIELLSILPLLLRIYPIFASDLKYV